MTKRTRDSNTGDAENHPRRDVLGSGAGAAAAALLGLVATACGDDETNVNPVPTGAGNAGNGGSGGTGGTGAVGGNGGTGGMGAPDADIVLLNGLLSAEYQAVAAYDAGAGLVTGAPNTDPLYSLREVIAAVAASIQAQHQLHAQVLLDAIVELGGTPVDERTAAAAFVPPAELLANPTITNVLKFAANAERGAAVAYNQTVENLEAATHRFLASSIEGDETQHFIVLAALVLGLAAPGANLSVDTADEVFPAAFVSSIGAEGGLDAMPPDYFP